MLAGMNTTFGPRLVLALAFSVLLTDLASAAGRDRPGRRRARDQAARPAAAANDAGARLHALFEEDWDWRMADSPVWASMLGDRRFDDQWGQSTEAASAARDAHQQRMLEKLSQIPRGKLSEADKVNAALFERELRDDMKERSFRTWLMPLNQRGGIQTANETAQSLRLTKVSDFEGWLARLDALPARIDQIIGLMRTGLAEGVTQPRVIMERVPAQIANQLVNDPEDSPFWQPFSELPESWSEADRQRIRSAALEVIETKVVPAYGEFHRFFTDEYLPGCRTSVGSSELPNGQAFYQHRVEQYTTTKMTADEVHALGHVEVARVRGEMEKIIDRVGFRGSFADFLRYLRTDPKFHTTDPDELLMRYRAFGKLVDPMMVELFTYQPRMPYGIKPIPAESAPDTTTAYYSRPAPDGSRAGTYYVNLYKPETRYFWEIPALSLHEAVPGHHFQIAVAQELGEIPKFRRFGGYTAYVEGWGLYAESLGEEIGVYDDPYDKFGQLTYEMWRAVRLVVDTGLHSKGWSRQRAIDFFAANAPKSEHDIINEIDRYIAWPGQALAYKIGELKIKELRRRATEALGESFDLRRFHDMLLSHGAVPLDVL
ncbi:MAG: DUF885 domain-containing protein [Acidobacteriota bacterium]